MRLWTADERLATLRRYDILDTAPEEAFEDAVEIARALSGAPIALVSLVDEERQWFKATRGVGDLRETPLSTSFCSLAVEADSDTLVVTDATADPRTAGMSLVTEGLQVRSYAGAVMRAPDGAPLGTVCVLDVAPRAFPEEVLASLQALARQVAAQLELRRAVWERRQATATLREANLGRELAMQAARLGRWDHHPSEGRRFYDARAREILGLDPGDDIGASPVIARIDARDRAAVEAALEAVLRPERIGPYDVRFRIGEPGRWVSCVGRTLFEDGVCTRFFGVVEDIDDRVRVDEQRAYLTEELNHRVKNILSLAQSLAESTLRTASSLEQAREVLAGRLQALAHAHDLLLPQRWRAAPLRQVAATTLEAAGVDGARVALDGPEVQLGSAAALQLALAMHELATNAGKYGALSVAGGRVDLAWAVEGEGAAARLRLAWSEHGGPPVTPPIRKGFGARVIGRATEAAFMGQVELDYAPTGLRWTLRAPLPAANDGVEAAG